MEYSFWSYFKQICAIPRGSGNEAAVRTMIMDFAESKSISAVTDKAGNLLMKKKGSSGREYEPPVIIQGHLDMVCEKNGDTVHDFLKDPIVPVETGGWLHARGTTLGADNGIAIAMAMALLVDTEASHPPLEVLCTVNEESGMNGAIGLEPGFFSAKRLINLDSEEEGIFYIGCAGGIHTDCTVPVRREAWSTDAEYLRCTVKGLKGGHSGMEIDKGLGNGIKLAGEVLSGYSGELRLLSLAGGDKHNAIPRECGCVIAVDSAENFSDHARAMTAEFNKRFPEEPAVEVAVGTQEPAGTALTEESTLRVITFLTQVPHGPVTMDKNISGLVESSTNMASVKLEDDKLRAVTSQRWSDPALMERVTGMVAEAAAAAGGSAHNDSAYPPWKPNPDSALLKIAADTYKRTVWKDPVITVVHAGLECGVISEKFPDMDMISFGPDITGAHSPDERVNIASAERVWGFLLELLKAL